jgi:hypothetical protein
MFRMVNTDRVRGMLGLENRLGFSLQVLGDVVQVTLLHIRCDIVILPTVVAYPSYYSKLPHISTR